jgi:hypothetical protein
VDDRIRRLATWPIALVATVILAGCSLVYPLGEYDEGSGGSGSGTSTSSASDVSSSMSSSSGSSGAGGAAPCGAGLYPPAHTLVESFDPAGTPSFLGCGQELNGELQFVLPASGDLYCTSDTQIPYCLTDSSISLKVPQAATASIPGMQTFIVLTPANGTGEIRLLLEGNGFRLYSSAGETLVSDVPYDPFSAAWWQLRGEGGELVLSTSSDGITWDERGRGTSSLTLDGVFVTLGANRYYNPAFPDSAMLPAETAAFDCYNVAAPCP